MALRDIITRRLFVVDAHYPRTIIAGVFFFTLLILWKVPGLEIDPGLRSLVPRDHPTVQNMELAEDLFSGSEIVVIAIETDSLLSERTLTKFSALQDSLEAMGLISRTVSIYSQKYIVPDDGGFGVEPLFDDIPSDSAGRALLLQTLHESGVIGNLVSEDLKLMCFIAQVDASLDFDEIEFREALYRIIEEIEAPESLSIKEQLRGHLEDFCTNRAMGKVKEDLNRGVPFTEEGETYFRYKDFWKFLERNKWKALEHNTTAHRLEEYFGVKEQRIRIYGMSVRVMVVKAFERPKNTDDTLPTIKKGSF